MLAIGAVKLYSIFGKQIQQVVEALVTKLTVVNRTLFLEEYSGFISLRRSLLDADQSAGADERSSRGKALDELSPGHFPFVCHVYSYYKTTGSTLLL